MPAGEIKKTIDDIAKLLRSFIYVEEAGRGAEDLKRWAEKLWQAHPWVEKALAGAESIEDARQALYEITVKRGRDIRSCKLDAHPLEWALIRDATDVLRNILSLRCEEMAGFSSIACLWDMACGRWQRVPGDMASGFFEEFHRLFLAVQGRSGVYGSEAPPHDGLSGREAAQARSDDLDRLAFSSEAYISSYPCGLDRKVMALRKTNRRRIMGALGASARQWRDYRWHLRHVIRDAATLGRLVELSREEREAIESARRHRIPFGVTPYYCSLMDRETGAGDDHAVRAQVIPSLSYVNAMIEHRRSGMKSEDFMMESETSPVAAVTRRYPGVAIFKPYNTCAQICVYCQRNWEIEDVLYPNAMLDKGAMTAALGWFERHPAVREVLITGGDPLVLADSVIERIIRRLASFRHIERIRIGTRTPVVLPQRFTPGLISVLKRHMKRPALDISIVTHFEHPYEVTPEAMEAVGKLRRLGMSVYNQMVFTIENSRRFEAVATRLAIKKIGVDPYYTFMMKGKSECGGMRAPIARAQQEQKEEARLMPGTIRTDETVYNVPRLGKNYVRAWQHHDVIMIMPDGSRVIEFHPWEKNISMADVYVDRDVPIYEYLQELARRGEDPGAYESIWYYY